MRFVSGQHDGRRLCSRHNIGLFVIERLPNSRTRVWTIST
jgi:hypothetical protein